MRCGFNFTCCCLRVQMQTHGCVQLAEEADKEHKKVADKIAERAEVVKVPPMTDLVLFISAVCRSRNRYCHRSSVGLNSEFLMFLVNRRTRTRSSWLRCMHLHLVVTLSEC